MHSYAACVLKHTTIRLLYESSSYAACANVSGGCEVPLHDGRVGAMAGWAVAIAY
jgi:hypothetical protein